MIVILILISTLPFLDLNSALGATAPSNAISPSWLEQQMIDWKPSQSQIYPLQWAMADLSSAYGSIALSYNTLPVQLANLNLLYQTGAQMVTLYPNFGPWLNGTDVYSVSQQQMYTDIVNNITASGHKLFIQDSAAEYYRTHKLTWNQFKAAWMVRDKTLASLYHPAYFEVVVEPQWYWPMISNATAITTATNVTQFILTNPVLNVTDWVDLTQNLCTVVKQVSPNTLCGASVPAGSMYYGQLVSAGVYFALDYMKGIAQLPNVDFLGFDTYSEQDYLATVQFVQQVGANGKQVWLSQAWNGLWNPPPPDAQQAQADVNWSIVNYYCAFKIHATGIVPFFTDFLASYNARPTDPTSLLSYYQERTPVFSSFQNMIAQNSTGPTSTTSSTPVTSYHSSSSTQTSPSSTMTTSPVSHTSSSSSQSGTHAPKGLQTIALVAIIAVVVIVVGVAIFARRKK